MFDYLTYYYKTGAIPFRSLSALPQSEAIRLMNEQYSDDPVGGRFRHPEIHLRDRRETDVDRQSKRPPPVIFGDPTPVT